MPKLNMDFTTRIEPAICRDDHIPDQINEFSVMDMKFIRINTYRSIAQTPEITFAIDEIVNEAIDSSVKNNLRVEVSGDTIDDETKDEITESLNRIADLIDKFQIYNLFSKYIIDGEINLFIQIAQNKKSILDLKLIEPWKINRIQEFEMIYNKYSNQTEYLEDKPYYEYSQTTGKYAQYFGNIVNIEEHLIAHANSGLIDEDGNTISYLNSVNKSVNDLANLENSLIMYRLTRAPEKRVFYVDTGTLPTLKAEEHVKSIMSRFKTKMDYDVKTGKMMMNNQNTIAPTTDYWMPRREGSTGTSIEILEESGKSMAEMQDEIEYFRNKILKGLFVPINRTTSDSTFNLNVGGEITREEVKFSQFVSRLSRAFCKLIYDIMKVDLVVHGVFTEEQWLEKKSFINIYLENNGVFAKFKDLEIIAKRLEVLADAESYQETYFSKDWINKNILGFDENQINLLDEQRKLEAKEPEEEQAEEEALDDEEEMDMGIPLDVESLDKEEPTKESNDEKPETEETDKGNTADDESLETENEQLPQPDDEYVVDEDLKEEDEDVDYYTESTKFFKK